ncbi:unnamed protein product, partial [Cylicostephanus goldi]
MRDLSGQLSAILLQIKKAKETRNLKYTTTQKPKPKVTILRNVSLVHFEKTARAFQGSANQTNDGRYNFVATITLVQDNGKNILVDTGLGTDINAAPSIHIVVTTHGHPDHAGGVHDFPDAIHYQGWYIHHRTMFNLSNLFENERHSLTDNVHLMRSTGHSSDDVAVVVSDEQTMGKVIIAGTKAHSKKPLPEDYRNSQRMSILAVAAQDCRSSGGGKG